MKQKNKLKKILISLILAITLVTFVMPNQVQAFDGGDLARPIFQFVAWVGDKVLEFLQETIGNGERFELPEGGVNITYTLGNIFANKVAMLDVNFIKPNTYDSKIKDGWVTVKDYESETEVSMMR